MNVRFYYRYPNKLNRSIERVFENISMGLEKYHGIKVKDIFAKSLWRWPVSMLYNMLRMGLISRGKGINHVTGDIHYVTLFMPRSRTVLTVHDLVTLHNSDVSPIVKRFVYYLWYYIPLKHLRFVTCISEATKQDLIEIFPFAKSKIIVIPNPVSNDYKEMKAMDNPTPVILHIGTRSNKNLERVVLAISSLKCHLRIIGTLSQRQKKLLDETKVEYSNVYGISDKEMIEEYRKCDIVSFPSLFEGFGMPVIEGQACGRVVVTSGLEPMKSVSGGAAVLVDPRDVESIRIGFKSVIEDKAFRQSLVSKGLINAKRYSISTISKKYQALYDCIL